MSETRHFRLLKTAGKGCKSSVKARRVLSQAPRVDSNQQAKKKRNNTVTREERGNEKGVVKKREGKRKTWATRTRVVIDIKRAACRAARLRRGFVLACYRNNTLPWAYATGVDDGVEPWRERDQRQRVNEETRRCECGARAPFTHRNWRWLMPAVVELWFNSISLELISSCRE